MPEHRESDALYPPIEPYARGMLDVGDGRNLYVYIPLPQKVSRNDLIRIVDELIIGPAPDTTWLPR